jgi:hypothetical protein
MPHVYEELGKYLEVATHDTVHVQDSRQFRSALLKDFASAPPPMAPQIRSETYKERIKRSETAPENERRITWKQKPFDEYLALLLIEGQVAEESKKIDLGKLFTEALDEWKKELLIPGATEQPWDGLVDFARQHNLSLWVPDQ